MAMKIPVVSSDVAENHEIITHGEIGLFATDAVGWRIAIISLIENQALRERMGLAGRNLIEEKYSVQKAVQVLNMIFARVEDD